MLLGCGAAAHDRSLFPVPAGATPEFHPPSLSAAAARAQPLGRLHCSRAVRPRFGVHLELFARGHVVIVPAGIGIAPPRRRDGAYVDGGRCRYPLITREPTGVLEVHEGTTATLGDLFDLWGQPLSQRRLAGFAGRVRAHVGGREWRGDPRTIPLTRHAQVVLQVGPAIVPHARYTFPPGL